MKPAKLVSALIAIFALFILGAVLTAADLGPRYVTEDAGLGSAYGVHASTTSNINYTIDCRKVKDVAIQLAFKQTGAGTDNHTLTIQKSVDGSSWNTVSGGSVTMVIAGNGTSTVYASTNFSVGAVGWLRISTLACGDSGDAMTNVVITVAKKIDAP